MRREQIRDSNDRSGRGRGANASGATCGDQIVSRSNLKTHILLCFYLYTATHHSIEGYLGCQSAGAADAAQPSGSSRTRPLCVAWCWKCSSGLRLQGGGGSAAAQGANGPHERTAARRALIMQPTFDPAEVSATVPSCQSAQHPAGRHLWERQPRSSTQAKNRVRL